MAMPAFRTFFPDVTRWMPTRWRQEYKLIFDNNTGVPVGIQNQNANGADGIWGLTPLSQAEINAPSAAMLADLAATYQLNEAPYSRYYSNGTELVPFDDSGGMVIPPGVNEVWFSPLIITELNGPLKIEGGLRLIE